ncbi:MAG: hypothetical protein Q8O03_04120 [Nanoarchaeota archaeon]|nr:hypothetical protein [Nanoarchaeota archaeon]
MSEHKTIEEILDEKISFKDNSRAYYHEMKKNLKLEAACILACEAGEWVTEIGAFLAGISFYNEIGILGGITAGASYSMYHVYKHAKKNNSGNASLVDAAAYFASTESGCVIGATMAEYAAGKFIAATNNPLTWNNAMVRALTLAPAFGIGLVLMSAFTYVKGKETVKGVSKKGVLQELKPSLEYELNSNKLEIKGKGSSLLIKEKNLPATYQKEFDKNEYSLYSIRSNIARVKPEYKHVIEEYCEELFINSGHELNIRDNIYCCSSHDHCSHDLDEKINKQVCHSC